MFLKTRRPTASVMSAPAPCHPLIGLAALLLLGLAPPASAQQTAVTPTQRATASTVAQAGVPLSELSPNAPASHTVKRGDTLWTISSLFLKSPWRWPELWGMNLDDIRNPHLIFPGQVLYLDRTGGRARLLTQAPGLADGDMPTVRLSPRTRVEELASEAIAPVSLHAIEAFLTDPMIVDETTFSRAPRIVATVDNRVLLNRGDRAYARGQYTQGTPGAPLLEGAEHPREFRVLRNAVALKDPDTGAVIGHEAQSVGKAVLARGESSRTVTGADGSTQVEQVPATIDIVQAREEMRVGDRLLPEPPRSLAPYVPHAPGPGLSGQIVSVSGNAVTFAAQNQVVVINRGRAHGIERGHVLALQRGSQTVTDKTDDGRPVLHLPGERNGLMMVFRSDEQLSYALVLQIVDGVKVGDRFTSP